MSEKDVRSDANRPRAGKDYRGGKDVTAEQFQDVFGFRGAEFGKWVGQGKGAQERQFFLNNTYDALMDLAEIVGVPPRAMSLNGTLGLAFGSRGGGWAAAHFEPSNLVINLTKPSGAGSLAHEWFHALDNYFARQRGGEVALKNDQKAYRDDNFITHKTEPMWVNKLQRYSSPISLARLEAFRKSSPDAKYLAAENWQIDPKHPQGVRPEVEARFAGLVAALDASPMAKRARLIDGVKESGDGYWSRTLERAARSFEGFVMSRMLEQGYHNDFLANVVPVESMRRDPGRYPYLLPSELAPISEAFGALFDVVQTRSDDAGNVAMFSRSGASVALAVNERLSEAAVADEVEQRIGEFAHQPPIRIRESAAGVIPTGATEAAGDSDIAGAVHNGAIYLFRDQLGSRADVQRTLFHELLHYGLRRFLTRKQYQAQMMRLYRRDAVIQREADRWAASEDGVQAREFDGEEYALARGVDEALAVLAEPNAGEYLQQGLLAKAHRTILSWAAEVADALGFSGVAQEIRGKKNQEARALIQQLFAKLNTDAPASSDNWGFTADAAFSKQSAAGDGIGNALDAERKRGQVAAEKSARAALTRIQANDGITSGGDLRDLLRVPGYSRWAQSPIVGDADASAALRAELGTRFGGVDWRAPKLTDQGAISLYGSFAARMSRDDLVALANLADQYDVPIAVRGKPETRADERKLMDAGFVDYTAVQELGSASRAGALFSFIRPGGGIGRNTPMFSRSPTVRTALDRAIEAKAAFDAVDSASVTVSDADAYFDLSDRESDAREQLVKELTKQPDDGFVLQGRNAGGRMIMLNGSAQNAGQWQLTRFDSKDEPLGDSQYRTKAKALEDFLREIDLASLQDFEGSFSRSRGPQQPASDRTQAVEALAAQITARWKNAPEVIVVESLDDRRVPQAVRDEGKTQQSQGALGTPEGFFHDGKVYLVASQLGGDADVVRVLFHESLGHFGLRGTFGTELGVILDRLAVLNAGKVRAKAKQYGLDYDKTSDRRIAAEEVLAEMAQRSPDIGWAKKAVAAIRTWLRQHVPGFRKMAFSDAEIVRNYLLPARAFVQRGGQGAGQSVSGAVGYSFDALAAQFRAAEAEAGGLRAYNAARDKGDTVLTYRQWVQVRTKNFKEWWGNDWQTDLRGIKGSVRQPSERGREAGMDGDAAGRFIFLHERTQEPRVFFHGTRDEFTAFDAQHDNKKDHGWLGVGHYATSDSFIAESYARLKRGSGKPSVMELFVRPSNPKLFTARQKRILSRARPEDVAMLTAEWVVAGHKGAALIHEDGSIEVAAFESAGLKSASSNNGGFDGANNDTMFSRSTLADAVTNFSQAGARNAFLDAVTTHGSTNLWGRTVGTQYHKAQTHPRTFGRVFDAVQDYIKDTSVFANKSADLAPSLLPKLDKMRDVFKGGLLRHGADAKDTAKAGEAIFQGTLDKELYDAATLTSRFGLNEKQIGLYREFRAAVDESLQGLGKTEILRLAGDAGRTVRDAVLAAPTVREAADILTEHIAGDGGIGLADPLGTAEQIGEKVTRIEQLQGEGYAPLTRFGRHTLHITGPDGGTEFFGMYESVRDANIAARQMRGDPGMAGMTFTQGVMSQEGHKLFNGLSMDSLELFADATGNADNPVYQAYLKLAVANRSALKRMIERKGIAGYSDDVARVLASFVTSNARMSAGHLHLTDAKKSAEAIPKEQGDLRDDAIKLVEYATNPAEEAAAVRGLLFTSFIGGSVASALVNMTQPITMTLPYLVQYGGAVKAGKRLTVAMAMVASGKGMDTGLADALNRAEADGIVSPQEIHHLQGAAMDSLGNKYPALKKAAFVWGSMFSLAEQFNRRVSFVAAYKTAQQEGIANPFAFAEKAVIETQGLYNKGNKAVWARGAVGATVMTFKQFSTHYLEFLVRMWKSGPEGKKAVAVALALLILMGGAGGLPFADDLDDLIDTLGQAMGHDTNSKRWKRQFVAQTLGLGDDVADVATRGLTALPGFPLDLSLRMGMGNLIPATGLFLRSNTDTARQLLEVAGAAGGLASNVKDGVTKALSGDPLDGVMKAMPMAVQNMAKAAQMWSTGEYRNTKGAKVMDVDAIDGAMKFIGFQPAEVARESGLVGETMRSIQLAKNVEGEIAGRWAQAMADGDSDGVAKARRSLAEWNADNPSSPIKITLTQVLARVKALKMSRADRTIKMAPKEMRATVKEVLS